MSDISHKLKFRTAYSQFYLCNKNAAGSTDSPDFWTDQALADKLAIEKGILGVGTGTYSYVKCEISLLTGNPQQMNFEDYDQVVEGSIEVNSGILQVLDCPNSTVISEFSISPGPYRIRVKTVGIASIVDEDIEADDAYLIDVWPASITPRQVLKRYPHAY
jgi:hypothetical protein